MKHMKCEQETTRNWDPVDRIERIYSSVPADIQKLDKLVQQYPDAYRCVWEEEDGGAKRYETRLRSGFRKPASASRMECGRRLAQKRGAKGTTS